MYSPNIYFFQQYVVSSHRCDQSVVQMGQGIQEWTN